MSVSAPSLSAPTSVSRSQLLLGLSLPCWFQGRSWKELGDHLGGQPQALQKGSRAKHNIRLLKMWIVNTSITGQNTVATRPQPSCSSGRGHASGCPWIWDGPSSTGTGHRLVCFP